MYPTDCDFLTTYDDFICQINPVDYTILIIDDDPDHLNLFGHLIQKEGFKLFSCSNVDDAIKVLSQKSIDLIICDIMMPKISGLEFAKNFTTQEVVQQKQSIPIILLTSCPEEIEFSALESGADLYCSKYTAHKSLLKQIHLLLQS